MTASHRAGRSGATGRGTTTPCCHRTYRQQTFRAEGDRRHFNTLDRQRPCIGRDWRGRPRACPHSQKTMFSRGMVTMR